jgi:sugar transferase (PEP-CTERM/EpsH1 system associated)
MDDLIFLAHRLPYPPDKGDKIRSWRMLSHLAERFRVHLGAFIDDKRDAAYLDELRGICASLYCPVIEPIRARLKSAAALATGQSLTERYYQDRRMTRWVAETMARYRPEHSFVFCSAMAPYLMPYRFARSVIDMVDADSEKWTQYAAASRFPANLLYRREGKAVLQLERRASGRFGRTLFISPAEAALFLRRAPEAKSRVMAVGNGVDLDHFNPARQFASPYAQGSRSLVFTGAMDYRPNIGAVLWFANEVMPLLRGAVPGLEFWIVGSNPGNRVRRLERDRDIRVTGRVADIRPYLAHADAAVAPLRIARGVQNKVLEAMSMARPVVVSPQALEGISLKSGEEALMASNAKDFAACLLRILRGEAPGLGARARFRVEADYRWESKLAPLDALYDDHNLAAQRDDLRARQQAAVAS